MVTLLPKRLFSTNFFAISPYSCPALPNLLVSGASTAAILIAIVLSVSVPLNSALVRDLVTCRTRNVSPSVIFTTIPFISLFSLKYSEGISFALLNVFSP